MASRGRAGEGVGHGGWRVRSSTAIADRLAQLDQLRSQPLDIVVIGGGATGLGVAVDAAARGLRTALLEAHDLAQGTSSRSTKLVHGGVRYLEQLDLGLVREALHERGLMVQNAPHLVHDLRFVVPRYSWWEAPFYGAGLKLYDALAGRLNLGSSRLLSHDETIEAIPNVQRDGLLGGISYHDGQFDDARMAVTLALTARDLGAVIVPQCRVTGLLRDGGRVTGVHAIDELAGATHIVRARVVVNATGIFADSIRRMEQSDAAAVVEPAQGVHLVLPRLFQPSDSAIMVPHTDDGRVLFVIPWHERVLVGTTDTPMREPSIEPRALDEEIEFILRNAARYLEREPSRADVLSVFAGQRPLVHRGGAGAGGPSKAISRNHEIFVGEGGMVTIVGGKWTTYRRMAEDTVDRAIEAGGLEAKAGRCATHELRLHGASAPGSAADGKGPRTSRDWALVYGSERTRLGAVLAERPEWSEPMDARLPYPLGVAAWSVREEMAFHLEDVLSRRTRALLLDARAAMACSERVARVMAEELGRGDAWIADEVNAFASLARGYLPRPE